MNVALLALAGLMAGVGPRRTVDLRTYSEPDGAQYSLSFCTRPSPGTTALPGHAFVGYSRLPANGPREYLAVGHTTHATTAQALLTFLGLRASVPGAIEEELFTSTQENCLVLLVNGDAYQRSVKMAGDAVSGAIPSFAAGRRTILRYTLGSQDCLGFMLRVLEPFRAAGQVRIPARGTVETPLPYLRRVIDAN